MASTGQASPRSTARMAGLFELLEAITSGFSQVIVPGMLVVLGDAAATAANVTHHQFLFRLSIAAAIVAVVCHVIWTFLFYELFKPVSSNLSLFAALFSLVAISAQAFSIVCQLAPLVALEDDGVFAAFGLEQSRALVLTLFRLSAQAFYIYLALFGFW